MGSREIVQIRWTSTLIMLSVETALIEPRRMYSRLCHVMRAPLYANTCGESNNISTLSTHPATSENSHNFLGDNDGNSNRFVTEELQSSSRKSGPEKAPKPRLFTSQNIQHKPPIILQLGSHLHHSFQHVHVPNPRLCTRKWRVCTKFQPHSSNPFEPPHLCQWWLNHSNLRRNTLHTHLLIDAPQV